MNRFLCVLFVAFLCGCGSQKGGLSTSGGSESAVKTAKAKIVEGKEDGEWLLFDASGNRVARVYVESGSTIPDQFRNGIIRILSDDGLKVGYANEAGSVLVPPFYFAAMPVDGTLAAVVPYSESAGVSSTDEAPSRTLTGNELWGIIDLSDGRFLRKAVFHRSWNYDLGRYVFSCPTSTFWINDEGELQGF